MKYELACLADLVFPRRCIRCSRTLAPHEKHLCLNCLSDLPLTYTWLAERNPMADKFNSMIQDELQSSGTTAAERYAFATALFHYEPEGSFKEIPHRLKYKSDIAIGRYFGKMLASRIYSARHLSDIDVVVPVPLHWTKRLKRGYNQAEVIAEPIARKLGVPLESGLLIRSKRTHTQTLLNVEEKKRNVKGAFTIRGDKVRPYRHILLVDDVFTTGSTVLECMTALRKAYDNEVRISVATLACTGQ